MTAAMSFKRCITSTVHTAFHELRIGIQASCEYRGKPFCLANMRVGLAILKEPAGSRGEVHDLVVSVEQDHVSAFPDVESPQQMASEADGKNARNGLTGYREKEVGRQRLAVVANWVASGPEMRSAAMPGCGFWPVYLDLIFCILAGTHYRSRLRGLKQAGLMAQNFGAKKKTRSAPSPCGLAMLHGLGKAIGGQGAHKILSKMSAPYSTPGGSCERVTTGSSSRALSSRRIAADTQEECAAVELPDRAHRVATWRVVLRLANRSIRGTRYPTETQRALDDKVVMVQTAGYYSLDRSAEEMLLRDIC